MPASTDRDALRLYADLDATPVINALGARTLLGGSDPAPEVVEAMRLAGRYYVDMDELLVGSGKKIAAMLDCPAALVTPGCAAALVLGTAACITGDDPEKMARLPDLAGLKNEIVIQKAQRYKYDRVVRMTGVALVEIGDAASTSPADLEAALGERTAAVLYPETDAPGDLLSLEETIAIAHRRGVPVLVDSAYRVYPLDGMRRYADMGADLFGYGAKYFGAPNSTGLLCGRRDLVDAARLHSFAGFEKHDLLGFGRPFKVDRQEVFGVVAALRRWLALDHDARFADAAARARALQAAVAGLPGADAAVEGTACVLRCRRAAPLAAALRREAPAVWCDVEDGALRFDMLSVRDGDERAIAARLRRELAP